MATSTSILNDWFPRQSLKEDAHVVMETAFEIDVGNFRAKALWREQWSINGFQDNPVGKTVAQFWRSAIQTVHHQN